MKPRKGVGAMVGAVAVGGAILAVTSTGTAGGFWGGATAPDAHGEPVQAAANATFEAFNGTVSQRRAGVALRGYALNGGMDRCMAERGFPEWGGWSGQGLEPPVAGLATSTWFADPHGRGFSDMLMATALGRRGEQRAMSAEPGGEESRAIDACLGSVDPASDAEVAGLSTPPGVARLRSEWWTMLVEVDERFGDLAGYHACLDTADISLLEETGLAGAELHLALRHLEPDPDAIPTSSDDAAARTAAWQRVLAVEREVNDADWSCRRDVYLDHIDEVGDAVEAFASDHAAAIARAQNGWQDVTARARDVVGHTAQTDSLD